MSIFFGILEVVLFLLVFVEKNDHKRKCMTWMFAVAAVAMVTVKIFELLF